MIAIVDYGMGNLRSVEKALQHLGHAAVISSDPAEIEAAERVILPGVGAFGAAMANLSRAERAPAERAPAAPLKDAVIQAARSGKPLLGICLGMQLFLSESDELGSHRGLELLPGRVTRFDFNGRAATAALKVPHMGWNALCFPRPCSLFEGLADGAMVYFVHSYCCIPDEPQLTASVTDHGGPFCSALWHENIFATQFHPEKSGAAGMRILDNFARR
jgi:glutamine amidotransferase